MLSFDKASGKVHLVRSGNVHLTEVNQEGRLFNMASLLDTFYNPGNTNDGWFGFPK